MNWRGAGETFVHNGLYDLLRLGLVALGIWLVNAGGWKSMLDPSERTFWPSWIGVLVVVCAVAWAVWNARTTPKAKAPPVMANGSPETITEEIVGRTFVGDRVDLDGRRFVNCIFRGVVLRFGAKAAVQFQGCRFENAQWAFDGSAGRTLELLKALHGAAPQLVEAWFEQIRGQPAKTADPKWAKITEAMVSVISAPFRELIVSVNGSGTTLPAIFETCANEIGRGWNEYLDRWLVTQHFDQFNRAAKPWFESKSISEEDFQIVRSNFEETVVGILQLHERFAKMTDNGKAAVYEKVRTRHDQVLARFSKLLDNIENLNNTLNATGEKPIRFWRPKWRGVEL